MKGSVFLHLRISPAYGYDFQNGEQTYTGADRVEPPPGGRVEEIVREHSGDFEVQLVAHDVKQRILTRGSVIKQMEGAVPPPPVPVDSGSPTRRSCANVRAEDSRAW